MKAGAPWREDMVQEMHDLTAHVRDIDHDKRVQFLNSTWSGISGLVDALNTDSDAGCSNESVALRREFFGSNSMPEPPRRSFLSMLWDAAKEPTMVVLAICAAVSVAFGAAFPESVYESDCQCIVTDTSGWIEGVAIFVAVVVVVLSGALQDYDKERKFRALHSHDVRHVRVVRDGSEIWVDTSEVVVGDQVVLECGMQNPCDGFVTYAEGLEVDESSVTGEADAVPKASAAHCKEGDCFILSNTLIVQGRGHMVATEVGRHSTWGHTLLDMSTQETGDTPLQKKLWRLIKSLGKLGLFLCTIVFIILYLYWALDTAALISQTAWSTGYVSGLVECVIVAVTLLVVVIPEGLPLAVMIALAYSMKAMTREKCLVRQLAACETMGSATAICSDKTGTLTQNRMKVTYAWLGDCFYESGANDFHKDFWNILKDSIALNSTAMRQDGAVVGSPTEMALLNFVDEVQHSSDFFVQVRQDQASRRIIQIPFSSETKRMVTLMSLSNDDGSTRLHCKGAPDRLLDQCANMMRATDGSIIDLDRAKASKIIEDYAAKGLRTLLVGYQDNVKDPHEAVLSMTLLAIFGIEDPVREEVPEAVRQCFSAGIKVRMVTGDNIATAVTVAQQCGIKTPDGVAMTGAEFASMSDDDVSKILPKLQVLARSQPSDKLRLVRLLQKSGEVVGVTGDGTNDAPALKEADVGMAMGVSGTDVAKQACDIIIMDDNFRSVVTCVKWGRGVFDSIRKFLQFQLTGTFAALCIVFIGAVSRLGTPLRAIQLLWVHMCFDTLAGLALATEPPSEALLLRRPHASSDPTIDNRMMKHILGQTVYQVAALVAVMFSGYMIPWSSGPIQPQSRTLYTMVFNIFVWCQLSNEFNCRSIDDNQNIFRGLHRAWLFIVVVSVSAVIQVIIIEFGSTVFYVNPLPWDQWLFCLLFGLLPLPLGVVLRAIPVPETPMAELVKNKIWPRPSITLATKAEIPGEIV